ncbi:unnamed protein product [Caretta caretta]
MDPSSVMANSILAVFSVLQLGQGDAKITQTPSLVLERGHTAYLRCEQTYGHNNMFWYRQDPDQGMQFLIYFYNKEQNDKGKITDRFQADQPQNELFRLNISSVQPEDSAVYFCASSLDTVLQSPLLPLQKPHLFLVSLQPQHRKQQAGCHHMEATGLILCGCWREVSGRGKGEPARLHTCHVHRQLCENNNILPLHSP